MSRLIDLTGQRFGRLVVIERAKNYISASGENRAQWLCQCDCGNLLIVIGKNLRRGNTQSCGCLQRERAYETQYKHGMTNDPVYWELRHIIERCCDPKCIAYPDYGGRGINLYSKWKDNPALFKEYVSQLPHFGETGRTLNRIDNDDNYEPGNIEWATKKEQARNTRRNIHIEYNGEKKLLIEWSEIFRIPYSTLKKRIFELHWSIEDAMKRPLRKQRNNRKEFV